MIAMGGEGKMAEDPLGIDHLGGNRPGASSFAPSQRVDRVFVAMAWLVGIDFLLGIGAIVSVPFGRASGWLPAKGKAMYVPHAVVGALLVVGALYLLGRYGASAKRICRLGARTGIAGIALGIVGGLLSVDHPLRLAGMGLMLVGGIVGSIGYAMPSLAAHDEKERARLAAKFSDDTSSRFG
jgi:hypothetical protein